MSQRPQIVSNLYFPKQKKRNILNSTQKGKCKNITRLNETTKSVNSFIIKMCKIQFSPLLTYITFCDQEGNANRYLFDNNDPSGIHINNEGVNKLFEQLYTQSSDIEEI